MMFPTTTTEKLRALGAFIRECWDWLRTLPAAALIPDISPRAVPPAPPHEPPRDGS